MVMALCGDFSDRLRSFPNDLHDHFAVVAAEVWKAIAAIRTLVSTHFQDALVSEANGQLGFEGSAFPSVSGIFQWVPIAEMEYDVKDSCNVQTISGRMRV